MNAHTTRFLSRSCNDLAQCTLNSSLLTSSSVKACKNKQFHDSFYPGLRFLELQAAIHRQAAPSQSADGAAPPAMLNSARRHCASRRRGRRVKWSDQRARLICRRCASDASYESVGNAGRIDVTTTD